MLQQIRREVGNATPLTLLLGAVIGAGLTRWLIQPLNLVTTFALETTTLNSVQIFSPLVVNLVWIGSCVPARLVLDSASRDLGKSSEAGLCGGHRHGRTLLLLPWFILGLFPSQLPRLPTPDLEPRSAPLLRLPHAHRRRSRHAATHCFCSGLASMTYLISKRCRSHPDRLAALISTAMVDGSVTVVLLEVCWLAILPPGHHGPFMNDLPPEGDLPPPARPGAGSRGSEDVPGERLGTSLQLRQSQ